MIALSRTMLAWQPTRPVGVLLMRQRTLTIYGVALLLLCSALTTIALFDPRTIDEVSVWLKPAKFALSIAIFSLTMAWFFGCVRPERRNAPSMRVLVTMLIASSAFELAYITWQGAHGLASHFNRSSLYYELMYGMMGVGALMLTATSPMLAWEIARRPAVGLSTIYRAGVVTGLTLCFVLGAGVGMYMAQGTGHSVGVTAGHLPVFGWNRQGGDLRIAHFLGIHSQQAIPAAGALFARLSARLGAIGLLLCTVLYVVVTLASLAQAIAGQPLVPALG